MKAFSLFVLSFVLGISLAGASPAEKRSGRKITKNEAEHIALRPHKGARVAAATLETVGGDKVWAIQIAQGKSLTMVKVNATSGRVVATEKVNR
ncbi:MAG TPA: PepSY domain-containing protein [Chthoniobacterales bacterium]